MFINQTDLLYVKGAYHKGIILAKLSLLNMQTHLLYETYINVQAFILTICDVVPTNLSLQQEVHNIEY